MKRRKLEIGMALWALLGAIILFFGVGCSTKITPKTQAARSLETVAVAVHGAMNTYGVLYRAGQVDAATRARVTRQYELYQIAAQASAAQLGSTMAAAPVDVQRLADDLLQFIATLQNQPRP